MALRPPKQRRYRSNPFNRQISDETVGAIAGFLLASTSARLLALCVGMEHWTITWRVINAMTFWAIWPLDRLGIADEPVLIGSLRPLDVLAGSALIILAFFLLATRTYRSRV
jgi:hypothetical protein